MIFETPNEIFLYITVRSHKLYETYTL